MSYWRHHCIVWKVWVNTSTPPQADLGQCLTCFPPFWGKEWIIFFLKGQSSPSDVPDFVISSFSLVLHLLGRPELAALSSPAASAKYKGGSLSYLMPCIHRAESSHWDPSFNFQILAFAALFCHLQEDVFSSVFMSLELKIKSSINIEIKTQ